MISDAQFTDWLQADGMAREILVEASCNHAGVETTRYLSRFGYHTNGADVPAHQPYRAALKGGMTFSRKVGITSTEPAVSISTGNIVIDNIDGRFDSWLCDIWTKRSLRVFVGDPSWPRADFRPIFTGRIASLRPSSRTELALSAFDELQRLNFPISAQLLGGTSDNKAALLPLTFGEPFNVTQLLVDPGHHTYQFNIGPAAGIAEVRDTGAPITSYTVDADTGKFSLTASPVGNITCDPMGALAGKSTAGAYLHTLAGIVHELVTQYGDTALRMTDADIDTAAFAAFDAANPATLGLYLGDKTNVLDAANQLCKSKSASLFTNRAGRLRLWRMPTAAEVAATVPVMDIGPGNMVAGSFAVVEIITDQPAVKLGWGRNWTPTASGLAGGLPESSTAELAKEYEELTYSDAVRVALHRYTTTPTREDTLLVNDSDSSAEAAARVDLRTQRRIAKFTGYAYCYGLDFGSVIRVSHPRLGDDLPHVVVVIGLDDDVAENKVDVEILVLT